MNAVTTHTTAEPLKFCRDCIWAKRPLADRLFLMGWSFARCTNPQTPQTIAREYLVTGSTRHASYCSTERSPYTSPDGCGANGRFWQPRK